MKDKRDEHGAEDQPNPQGQPKDAPPVQPADGETDPPPTTPGVPENPGKNP